MTRNFDDFGGVSKTGLATKKPNEQLADAGESRHRPNFKMGEAEVFAENLRLLTQMRGMTPQTASVALSAYVLAEAERRLQDAIGTEEQAKAKAAVAKAKKGVQAKWYRRLMKKGVTRSHQMTRAQFHGLAGWCGLKYADLWRKDLITFQLTGEKPTVQKVKRKQKALTSALPQWVAKHQTVLRKLAELLDRDDFQFLIPLIDRLYLSCSESRAPLESYQSGGKSTEIGKKTLLEIAKSRRDRKESGPVD